MKKFIKFTGVCFLVIALSSFPVFESFATKSEARAEAEAAKFLLEIAGYTVRNTYTEGVLDEGEYASFTRTLYSGNVYALVVGGCSYTEDIDIYVYDKYGDLVASDSDASKIGIAEFYASYTGSYRIKIKMYDSTSSGVHWALRYAYM